MSDTLIKGVAYHGNRMLSHVREDMKEIARSGFNAVVHMFSHNDMIRHSKTMQEIIEISREYGLEVYVDNWGLAGAPGDPSHFLSWHPECHQVYNTGSFKTPAFQRVMVCFNRPEFIEFTKEWIDMVYDIGARKLMWDEPHMTTYDFENGIPQTWTCRCEKCKELFREKYAREMPDVYDEDVEAFRLWTFKNYFRNVCNYAASKDMENALILQIQKAHGICLSNSEDLFEISTIHNIGTDPYQKTNGYLDVYNLIYKATRENMDMCRRFCKDHHLWIKGFGMPKSSEEDIIAAADAMYDAGARKIFIWGYRGSEANDYRMHCPESAWKTMIDAMARITERHRNDMLARAREIEKNDTRTFSEISNKIM